MTTDYWSATGTKKAGRSRPAFYTHGHIPKRSIALVFFAGLAG